MQFELCVMEWYKTGRKDNKSDASWALPLAVLGFVMLISSYLLSNWAIHLQFN